MVDLPGNTPYDGFLSGGISDDNSFEIGLLARQPFLHCEAYDPTSNGGPTKHPRYHFHQEALPPLDNVFEKSRNLFVKIDIEGAEWPWIIDVTLDGRARHIAQLVVELHSPHYDRWDWEALDRLSATHVLVHAHGNNWDGIVTVRGIRIPGTLETTWVRADLASSSPEALRRPSTTPIPGGLDMPNDPKKPDHVIDWWPFVDTEDA